MGQEEVMRLLEVKPRLCSREIAEILGWGLKRVRHILSRMIDKDIKALTPTREEYKKLLEKYPNIIYVGRSKDALNRLKVFEIK